MGREPRLGVGAAAFQVVPPARDPVVDRTVTPRVVLRTVAGAQPIASQALDLRLTLRHGP